MSEDNCYNSATPGQENITGIHQILSSIVSDVIIQHSILTEYAIAMIVKGIILVIPSDTP